MSIRSEVFVRMGFLLDRICLYMRKRTQSKIEISRTRIPHRWITGAENLHFGYVEVPFLAFPRALYEFSS
jgi:hypothetical protein